MAADVVAAVYWGGMVVLFFFWVYGIVSFARDLRYKYIPAVLRYRRGRKELEEKREEEREREEKEQQLY
ncbi:hypothetical protein [Halomicrobium urmianum]|uniref:hypothetical protein n=1 Tax=Halomicrobium urmianum TaxID=1586233 RepID=UPI001CD95B2A|nr:hypothetical protein [Halomicrobium urmianum]